jgi:hypothetical protein
MRHPILADGDRRQPPMLAVMDSAGRARQRVLALFLPVGGNGPAGRLDLAGSGAAAQPHSGACRRALSNP